MGFVLLYLLFGFFLHNSVMYMALFRKFLGKYSCCFFYLHIVDQEKESHWENLILL